MKALFLFLAVLIHQLALGQDAIALRAKLEGKWLYDSTRIGETKVLPQAEIKKDYLLFKGDTLTLTQGRQKIVGKWEMASSIFLNFQSFDNSISLTFKLKYLDDKVLYLSDNGANGSNLEGVSYFTKPD